MLRKCRTVLGLLILLISPATPNAQAHGQLVSSNPVANSQLSALPEKVRLEFDDKLQVFEGKAVNILVVEDSYGKQIDASDSIVAGASLSVSIRNQSGSGKFHVSYRVVSGDGHPVSADYYFTVAEAVIPLATASPSMLEASPSVSVKDLAKGATSPKDSFRTRYQDRILFSLILGIAIGVCLYLVLHRAKRVKQV